MLRGAHLLSRWGRLLAGCVSSGKSECSASTRDWSVLEVVMEEEEKEDEGATVREVRASALGPVLEEGREGPGGWVGWGSA